MTTGGQSKAARENDSAARRKLLAASKQISATIGSEFFHTITKHLAAALAADCVIAAEFAGGHMERCRALGAWCDGAAANFEYQLVGSAMSQIALGRTCQFRTHARDRFPSDELLSKVCAEACVGVPLLNKANHPVGGLMAIFRRRVHSLRFSKAMLEQFAERAAAEMIRAIEEQKLQESEQRYRVFIRKNADAMWRIEFEQPIPIDLPEEEQYERIHKYGYLAEGNDALARLVGAHSAEQLIGSRIVDIMPKSDPTVRHATMIAIRSKYAMTSVETNPIDPSGKRKCMLRSQWGIVEDGQLKRIWGSNRDITELRHAEMALDASEERMADLVESMRLLVVFLDLNGTIEFCNNYVSEVTGWPPDELIGKDWLKALIPADERSRLTAELDRNAPDRPMHFESSVLARHGHLQIEWDATVLRNSMGNATARALVGRNITEHKELQEQVLQAQKLAGIGRLAGGLAHDFNNLLTVIIGYTAKLLDETRPSDPSVSSLTQIQRAAEKSAELAHRLLTFSRREVFRPQVLDLNALVEDVRGLMEALTREAVRLILDLETPLRPVRVDPSQLHQVLVNLAANARDAMTGGGRLTIATCNIDVAADDSHAAGIPPGEYVLLTVGDTGTGMNEDVKSHLFEPFFTTKERGKGTGLGLAMVYGIVQQSAGYIRVDSEPGVGTTFRIFLPHARGAEAPKPSKSTNRLPRGTETVLLVQDGRSLGNAAVRTLGDLGYTVLQADGPVRALEIIREKASRIQVMVSPSVSHGMPAEVLLRMVKEFQPGIRALVVAGSGAKSSVAESDPEAGLDLLPRRFSRKALAFKIRELLDRG